MTPRLAERLKTRRMACTRGRANRFMAALLRGRMDRGAYAAFLGNLHALYGALEPALKRHADLPAIASFDLDALARTAPLADDLAASGRPFRGVAATASGRRTYVARIAQLDAAQPELLLAHAYVRYLGDLSGGQLLRRIIQRSDTLHERVGTAFYDFGDAARGVADEPLPDRRRCASPIHEARRRRGPVGVRAPRAAVRRACRRMRLRAAAPRRPSRVRGCGCAP